MSGETENKLFVLGKPDSLLWLIAENYLRRKNMQVISVMDQPVMRRGDVFVYGERYDLPNEALEAVNVPYFLLVREESHLEKATLVKRVLVEKEAKRFFNGHVEQEMPNATVECLDACQLDKAACQLNQEGTAILCDFVTANRIVDPQVRVLDVYRPFSRELKYWIYEKP